MLGFATAFNWTLLLFCILSVAAISGMFTEKCGIVNIAINGMMIFGALGYLLFSHNMLRISNSQFLVIPGTLIGMLFGGISSTLFAFAAIKLKSSQTISGFAFNLLASGIALLCLSLFGEAKQLANRINYLQFAIESPDRLWRIPIISFPLVITALIIVVGYILLYKTNWGLRFRSIGENPHASDVAGINVTKYQWHSILISGTLAGLAGAFFAQATTERIVTFDGDVAGLGYLALAIMIMGQWNILLIAGSTLIFSLFLGIAYAAPQISQSLQQVSTIFQIVPYLLTLIVVISMSKRSKAPAASGIPYNKSTR
ncbi:ABC transporter permease [Mycoplasma sp. 744]|uniref:ABC transporter permease n=1 Tax=unclassified Mycoplasma TaxID=2683645 RepID=UPI00211C34C1|nr:MULTISPECIES: ABC transporter permease [unclassified Mycoplasma]MEA4115260.1 ABC transporter permease [Mycoplasma sp. 744]UUM19265.1 ABC transporter permease [Mycoplasma sp. 1018B]